MQYYVEPIQGIKKIKKVNLRKYRSLKLLYYRKLVDRTYAPSNKKVQDCSIESSGTVGADLEKNKIDIKI